MSGRDLVDELRQQTNISTKLIFIHVAKTAGTAVKQIFSGHFPVDQCVMDLENSADWVNCENISRFEQLQFLSGHMAYPELERRIDMTKFVLATCLRNPIEHIVSHIVHFRRLADKENQATFDACSKDAQLLIAKLAKSDLSSPEAISYLYSSMTDFEVLLFDNCQTRYFTRGLTYLPDGQRIGLKEMEYALQTLKQFDHVGDVKDIRAFVANVCHSMGWSVPVSIPRVNAFTEKYGLDISKPAIVNALWPFIHFDYAIYSQQGKLKNAKSANA